MTIVALITLGGCTLFGDGGADYTDGQASLAAGASTTTFDLTSGRYNPRSSNPSINGATIAFQDGDGRQLYIERLGSVSELPSVWIGDKDGQTIATWVVGEGPLDCRGELPDVFVPEVSGSLVCPTAGYTGPLPEGEPADLVIDYWATTE